MCQIHPIVAELLSKRGIFGEEELREFLSEKPRRTYDPFLLPDLEAGVDFVLRAVRNKKKICIYGDYDADGIASVSILMEFLGNLTERLEFYIPSRFDEGYGLNLEAVKKIREGGADALITVDCGSVSFEEVELAKELGMEVLVTDHHSITDVRADCLLINPKRADSEYPFGDLAGCGVAFKLIQGIQKKEGLSRLDLNRTLDLVALGTIADVVPLLDENRTLVKYGMRIVASGARPGLAALIEKLSFDREHLSSDNVSFGIAPHLNAAGRIGDASVAVRLMLERDSEKIDRYADQLIACNQKRKALQEEAFDLCQEIVEEHLTQRKFLLVYGEGVHEGVAGIVAGKLKEKYERPVILLTPTGEGEKGMDPPDERGKEAGASGGYLKGTGRSIPGVHLYRVLKSHEEWFLRFGGHEGACGFTMEKSKFPLLEQALESDMEQALAENPDLFAQTPQPDMTLDGAQVTLELAEHLGCLEPFGSKNPKPLFLLEQATLTRQRPMGDGRHIRFLAICQDGCQVACVLFRRAKDYEKAIYGGKPVDLMGTVDFQEWKGNKSVQFIVESMV